MKKFFSFLVVAGCMSAPFQLAAQDVKVEGQGSGEVKDVGGQAGNLDQPKVDANVDVNADTNSADADVNADINATNNQDPNADGNRADVDVNADVEANRQPSTGSQTDVRSSSDVQGSLDATQLRNDVSGQTRVDGTINGNNIRGSANIQGQTGSSGVMYDANGRVINNGTQWNDGTTMNGTTQWNTTGGTWQSMNGQTYHMNHSGNATSGVYYGNTYDASGNVIYTPGTVMPAGWTTGTTAVYQPAYTTCYRQPYRVRRGLFSRFR
jgi:autotransporter translocation and assembly factor TamB